ncbi:hypothetical protein H5410_040535 [Solanum commersonii]|uniref:Uncharacterized protein n=1 Tax=Solanum commersonii TaxID=4109 RepID=A0A9J5XQD8_SOLCO|nr:hypothetical protein H5410_040535 [Solanum commersonii]
MIDRSLNDRASLSFPCMIRSLYTHAHIPPNKLVDKYVEATKVTVVAKIKDVANPLHGSRARCAPPLVVLPHVAVESTQIEGTPSGVHPSPAPFSSTTVTLFTLPIIFLETCCRTKVDQKNRMDGFESYLNSRINALDL